MAEFRMPSLGADMDEGTLLHWHVRPGDVVRKGDIVAEVDTAKAAIEVECFDDGVVGEILVPEGTTVPVGTPLATIEAAGAVGKGEPVRSEATEEQERREAAATRPAVAEQEPEAVVTVVAGRPGAGAGEPAAVREGEAAGVRAAAAREPIARRKAARTRERAGAGEAQARESAEVRAAAAAAAGEAPVAEAQATTGQAPSVTEATGSAHRARRGTRGRKHAAAEQQAGEHATHDRQAAAAEPEAHRHVTPLVRKLAQEAGIDLETVTGSGPDGRILRADIERVIVERIGPSPSAAAAPSPASPTSRTAAAGHRQAASEAPSTPPLVARTTAAPQAPDRASVAAPAPAPRAEHAVPPSTTEAPAYVAASGRARRLAQESGIDLAEVRGSGPGGAVLADDVRAASARPPAPAKVREPQPLPAATAQPPAPARDQDAMRRAIATAMTHSKQTIPHYYLSSTIDLTAAADWLRAANEAAPVTERILMAALQVRAVALAARKVPAVNGQWIDDAFRPSDTVDVGTIVSLRGGGILAPTIAGADTLELPELMKRLRAAAGRARSGRLLSSDTAPASITVTNLGELGVESVTGVIPPPQVAIVGFGAVAERPCAINGLLGVRPQVTVTLAADHRASDGAVGARFLNTIAELLQHPEQL